MSSARKQFRDSRNEGFVCVHCGVNVRPLENGSCRNHCPQCLASKHLDEVPGDRAGHCGGLMECVAVQQDARRGWMLVHRCTRCGVLRRNKAALHDPVQPDLLESLVRIAMRRSGDAL